MADPVSPVPGAQEKAATVPSAACDLVMRANHPPYEQGGPCGDCAFRAGTDANSSVYTVQLARACVEGFRPFHCHLHSHLCRGFVAAMNVRGEPKSEDEKN